jgi:hypothetical protein
MSQKKTQLLNPLSGNINVAGVITASSFVGSGEGLTGVASTDNIQTATSAKFLSNVNVSGITTLTTLQVTGLTTVGVVTGGTSISAGVFYGDGSALTGIDASTLKSGSDVKAQANPNGIVITGVATASSFVGDITGNVTGNATGLTGTPSISVAAITASGNVTVGGTLTYQDVTNMDVLGIGTFQQGIQVLANGLDVTGFSTFKTGVSITGVCTATSFSGDGSNLSGISVGITTTERAGLGNTTIFLDLSNAQHHTITLAAGISTIDCTGGSVGDSHSVVLINPSSVGTGVTVGFATDFLFPSGSTPSLPTGASDISMLSFVVKQTGAGGTEVLASAGLNYSN